MQRENHIKRKMKIDPHFYKHRGQYDKGKVHCSCATCQYYRELYQKKKIKRRDKKLKEDMEDLL